MKQIINLAAILVIVSLLSSNIFAQEQNEQNRKMIKKQTNQGTNIQGPNWIDENGDGICDNIGSGNSGNKYQGVNSKGNKKSKFGDGSGLRPQDGSGLGKGNGTGACDGSGPKGSNQQKGKK